MSDSEGKRFPLNMRTTLEVREKIQRAAELSGRSMSQEVEYRIERSFWEDGLVEVLKKAIREAHAEASEDQGIGLRVADFIRSEFGGGKR